MLTRQLKARLDQLDPDGRGLPDVERIQRAGVFIRAWLDGSARCTCGAFHNTHRHAERWLRDKP